MEQIGHKNLEGKNLNNSGLFYGLISFYVCVIFKCEFSFFQVSELREELEARSMSPKGLKNQLLARLQKALKSEQDIEEKGPEEVVPEVPKEIEKPGEKVEEDENKKKEVRFLGSSLVSSSVNF